MKKPRRILIGLRSEDHAVELADLACRTAARNATVFLIHVIELPDTTPLDADVPDLEKEARAILRAAERVVRRSGLKVCSNELSVIPIGSRTLARRISGKGALSMSMRASCMTVMPPPE